MCFWILSKEKPACTQFLAGLQMTVKLEQLYVSLCAGKQMSEAPLNGSEKVQVIITG